MSEYAFIYDPSLSRYELSDAHPFKPIRLELTKTLLEDLGLLKLNHLASPKPIAETELLSVHEASYVEMLKAVSGLDTSTLDTNDLETAKAYAYGLGTPDNPIFPKMHQAILGVCAATVSALELVASGKKQRALNLSGGLHHAHAARASGFCVYNDLALAVEWAVKKYQMRVAYVDLDAHHGDGVQGLFYERKDVMSISLHESGRHLFPGTGFDYEVGKNEGRGTSINMPLEPFTEASSYLESFESVVPIALRQFKPDIIVLQAGADMHRFDPLADIALNVSAMQQSYERMSELADELCSGRLVATGGGGYDPYRTVPRVWASLWAALSRQKLSNDIPQVWLDRWQAQSPVKLPLKIQDELWQAIPRRSEIAAQNRKVAQKLMTSLARIWQE